MKTIDTKYGTLGPMDHITRAPDGNVISCVPAAPILIETPLGALVTQNSTDDMRRPKIEPLEFHPDGTLRSIALEERTEIPTPIGPVRAELVTFYPCGSLRRVFPLNGKLSGYWSEKEEASLDSPMTVPTPAGTITARIVGLQFYPGGQLRSLTLWPGEKVEIDTPLGRRATRIGIAFYKDGNFRSFEPDQMLTVPTPIGDMEAFDPDALGIHGDLGSLSFHENGQVASLLTPLNTVEVTLPDGSTRKFAPEKVPNLCDELVMNTKPLRISFHPGIITLGEDSPERFQVDTHHFKVSRLLTGTLGPIGYHCGA